MKTIVKALAFMALCMPLAGCVQENMDEFSRVVKFGARTEVSSVTRTSYSGDINTTTNIERIDWENGDVIRIVSDKAKTSEDVAFSDYDLALSSNTGKFSYATAEPHGTAEHGLLWGSGTNTFYACYPAPDPNATTGLRNQLSLSLESNGAAFFAVLPADQSYASTRTGATEDYYGNMDLAFMTAAATGTEGNDVILSFIPVVTTFYVTVVNDTDDEMTLQRVALSSAANPLTGSYKAWMYGVGDLDSDHNPRNYQLVYSFLSGSSYIGSIERTADNSTIYATFSNLTVAPDESVTVALFAIPQDNITQLTLSVTSAENGTVSLPLQSSNGGWLSFTREHKHNISNVKVPGVDYFLNVDKTEIEYTYSGEYDTDTDAQEFTVTSYKTIGSQARTASPWKTQVQVGNDWLDLSDVIADNTTYPEYAWLSNIPVSSESPAEATASSPAPSLTFHKDVGPQDVISHEERLRAGVVYGTDGATPVTHNSPSTAIDLSYYDFVNRKMETVRYSANTYIIAAPGYYKIPIIFGNAMENGVRMPDSFSGRAARLGHLDEFICPYPNRGGTESSIHLVSTRPWLNARRSASSRIHWEKYSYWDESTESVLTSSRRWSDAAGTTVIDDLSITTGTDNERFIVFNVREDNIRPGNVLIASLDQYDNVQWSWQIWITDQDMNPVTINNGTRSYVVMPVNLGWTDLEKGLHYEPREAVLRFASTAIDGLYSSNQLTVKQTETDLTSKNGWSTFYQWGRKDPLTDGIAKPSNNDGYLHESVKHPSDMFYDKSSFFGDRYYDWTIHNYSNLWESKNTDYDSSAGTLPNHKTVYDPSPRRYCVPPDEVWDGFASNKFGYSSASAEGIEFNTGVGTNTIFFPASGLMNYTSASSSKGNDILNGYWTYHPGEGTERRASYCLSFKYNNSLNTARVWVKQYQDDVDYISRAYGLSVRPVYYDESAVVTTSDGTLSTVFNFEEMWGTTSPASDMNGYSTSSPSSVEAAYQNDFTLSIVTERDVNNKKIRYEYDSTNGYGSLILPDSYDGTFVNNYNRFTVGTSNSNIHIVQIILAYAQKGVEIIPDSPTFDADDAVWVDSAAAYDATTQTWTGGKQSVQFTMDSGTGDPWKVMAITVNYYVSSSTP